MVGRAVAGGRAGLGTDEGELGGPAGPPMGVIRGDAGRDVTGRPGGVGPTGVRREVLRTAGPCGDGAGPVEPVGLAGGVAPVGVVPGRGAPGGVLSGAGASALRGSPESDPRSLDGRSDGVIAGRSPR